MPLLSLAPRRNLFSCVCGCAHTPKVAKPLLFSLFSSVLSSFWQERGVRGGEDSNDNNSPQYTTDPRKKMLSLDSRGTSILTPTQMLFRRVRQTLLWCLYWGLWCGKDQPLVSPHPWDYKIPMRCPQATNHRTFQATISPSHPLKWTLNHLSHR